MFLQFKSCSQTFGIAGVIVEGARPLGGSGDMPYTRKFKNPEALKWYFQVFFSFLSFFFYINLVQQKTECILFNKESKFTALSCL